MSHISIIQAEIDKIQSTDYARKSDKQLLYYEEQSIRLKQQLKGKQPIALREYNSTENRQCKLTKKDVRKIREKYNPHVYGKKRLAQEYHVSKAVIHRIIEGVSWKIDSG